MLAVVGLNHRTAPIAVRELLASRRTGAESDLTALVALDGIDELAAIANCWRVELFVATRCPAAATLALREALTTRAGRHLPLFSFQGEQAFRHLVRVASSLESAIIGEAGILAAVEEAFDRAFASGAAGAELASCARRAFDIARRVRSAVPLETAGIPWGHAVATLAEKVFGPLAGRRMALVGAGELARAAGAHLRDRGGEIILLDQTLASAKALARELGAEARPLGVLDEEILHADVVVSASAATADAFGPARIARLVNARGRRLVLVDLAVPRAIPPEIGEVPDAYLCNVDDLDGVVRSSWGRGPGAVARAEQLIEQEVARWARGDPILPASPPAGRLEPELR